MGHSLYNLILLFCYSVQVAFVKWNTPKQIILSLWRKHRLRLLDIVYSWSVTFKWIVCIPLSNDMIKQPCQMLYTNCTVFYHELTFDHSWFISEHRFVLKQKFQFQWISFIFFCSAFRPCAAHHPPGTSQSYFSSWLHHSVTLPHHGQPHTQHPVGERWPKDPGKRWSNQYDGKWHLSNHQPAGI